MSLATLDTFRNTDYKRLLKVDITPGFRLHLRRIIDKLTELDNYFSLTSVVSLDLDDIYAKQFKSSDDVFRARGIHLNKIIKRINDMIDDSQITTIDKLLPISHMDREFEYVTDAQLLRGIHINAIIPEINNLILHRTNLAPEAKDISITGHFSTSAAATIHYTYYDRDGDEEEKVGEDGTMITFYVADDENGTNESASWSSNPPINIGFASPYQNKFVRVGIKPMAKTGTKTGVETFSQYYGPIIPIQQYLEFTSGMCNEVYSSGTWETMDDTTIQVRSRIDSNRLYIDIQLTPTGFSGIEGIDWRTVIFHQGQTNMFRMCIRDNDFVIDGSITGNELIGETGFDGLEGVNWENLYKIPSDGLGIYRMGSRNGYFVIDETLTPLGFNGVENTDWKVREYGN